MRVLIVVHGFPPLAQGGSEIHAHDHALALHRRFGDEVLVLTREQDAKRPEYELRWESRSGWRIAWINNTFRSVPSFEATYRSSTIGAIAEGVIDDFQPDVAHVHHLTCLSTTIVSSLAERRVPIVFTLHDYWLICHRGQLLDRDFRVCDGPEEGSCTRCLGADGRVGRIGLAGASAMRAAERYLPATRHVRRLGERVLFAMLPAAAGSNEQQKRMDHMRAVCAQVTEFLAPSRQMRDRFVRFGIDAGRITLSSYGVDAGPFTDRRRSPSTRLRLGFIGSLMISKAPHVLIEAAAMMPQDAVSVELYGAHVPYHGDDSYEGRLEPLLRAPNVHLHGPVPHDQVPAAFSSIDVLVVPSIWPENSPFVIHEAFLAGVPVVASRIGSIPDLIEDGQNGLLFRPGDAADLAATLRRLVSDPPLLQRLRSARTPVRTLDAEVGWMRQRYEQHLADAHLRSGTVTPPTVAGQTTVGHASVDGQTTPVLREGRTAAAVAANDPDPTPGAPARLAAVVLNFRTPDDTWLAVKSLIASDRFVDHIIVVDNGDLTALQGRIAAVLQDCRIAGLQEGRGEGTKDEVGKEHGTKERAREAPAEKGDRAQGNSRASVEFVATGQNLGFSGGMNVGIRRALEAGADRVVLVNSDVHVPPDCLGRLERALRDTPTAGIAAPVLRSRSWPDRIASRGIDYSPATGRMRHRDAGALEPIAGSRDVRHNEERHHEAAAASGTTVDAVSGCVMLVDQRVFQSVGLLDEAYFFGFEDLDLCLRARHAGFVSLLVPSAVAYHEGGRSIGAQSPQRLYFAARNHLRLARTAAAAGSPWRALVRPPIVVLLNLAHAVRARGGSPISRIAAVLRGTRDYMIGRFGPGEGD